MDWSLVLYLSKWVFLALVYASLLMLLTGVLREMRQHLPQESSAGADSAAAVSIGRLRVLQPGSDARLHPGATLALRPETRLGAKRGSTLILRDRYISASHTRLRWDGVSWWAEDLNSTNGTFINGQRIPPGAPAALPYGATLQIGDSVFELIE